MAAEALYNELSKHSASPPSADARFKRLRALVLSELHPDHTNTEGIERIVRTELFKGLWPKIEKV